MNDYTPVPEADLEASFVETLALLRKNSTEGHTALSELQKLAQQLGGNAYLRELEYKNVMATLEAVNTTLKEAKSVIANSRPAKQTRIEYAKDVLTILCMGSIVVLLIASAMLFSAEALIYFKIL